jgi:hypothetical protein
MNKELVVLIDGDMLVYRSAYSVQKTLYRILVDLPSKLEGVKTTEEIMTFNSAKEAKLFIAASPDKGYYIETTQLSGSVQDVKKHIDEAISSVLFYTGATEYSVYLAKGKNYREDIATIKVYKEDRPEKPILYEAARAYLIDQHLAVVTDNQETDDALGIMQRCYQEEGKYEPIIASFDKDLNMIAGLHYDFTNKRIYSVDVEQADEFFYTQLLTGDSTDNIPGIYRIGPVKAKEILKDCKNNVERYEAVLSQYYNACKNNKLKFQTTKTVEEIVLEIGRLLWIRRKPHEMWTPPVIEVNDDTA